MEYLRALKPFVKSPERMSRARWSAHTCPTTRAEARGGDDEGIEVLVGRLRLAVMETSPGGWTPIRAVQTTTQAVPASRPAGRSVTHGEPPAELEIVRQPSALPQRGLRHILKLSRTVRIARSTRVEEFTSAFINRSDTSGHLAGGSVGANLAHAACGDESLVPPVSVHRR